MLRTFTLTLASALFGFFILACNAVGVQPSRPSVIIASPPGGSVYTVGEQVAVQSTSTDTAGIVRVSLIVDGVTVHEDPSPVATGQQQYSVVQTWTADKVGQRNIIVRATNAQGVTSDSGIYITVQQGAVAQPTAVSTSAPLPVATDIPVPTATATPVPSATATTATVAQPTAVVVTVIVVATNPATDAPTTTQTPATTSTATATVSSASTACTDNSAFIADLSIPDGTIFLPNTPFVKSWRIQNNGTCAWQNYTLSYVSGPQLATTTSFPVPATAAGATADLSISLASPAAFGTYKGYWRLRNAAGALFGTSLTALINVPNPNAPNPTAPATFTPTVPPPTVSGGGACTGQPNAFTFSASASTVQAGKSVILSWGAVTNASVVFLTGGALNQGVGAPGQITVSPTTTTTYTLTATCNNGGGKRTNSVTITVNGNVPAPTATSKPISGCASPKIGLFFGNPATINAGQSVTLSWSGVTGADKLFLSPGAQLPFSASGSTTVSPTSTTNYQLTALCSFTGANVTTQLTINVNTPAPACSGNIEGFNFRGSSGATQDDVILTIAAGDPVVLEWDEIKNVDKIHFTGGGDDLDVHSPGIRVYHPTVKTTYDLTASCSANGNSIHGSVGVTIKP